MIGYRAKGTIWNDRSPLQYPAGLLSQWVQGRVLVGARGAKPPETLKILKFTLLKRGQKLTLMVHC